MCSHVKLIPLMSFTLTHQPPCNDLYSKNSKTKSQTDPGTWFNLSLVCFLGYDACIRVIFKQKHSSQKNNMIKKKNLNNGASNRVYKLYYTCKKTVDKEGTENGWMWKNRITFFLWMTSVTNQNLTALHKHICKADPSQPRTKTPQKRRIGWHRYESCWDCHCKNRKWHLQEDRDEIKSQTEILKLRPKPELTREADLTEVTKS